MGTRRPTWREMGLVALAFVLVFVALSFSIRARAVYYEPSLGLRLDSRVGLLHLAAEALRVGSTARGRAFELLEGVLLGLVCIGAVATLATWRWRYSQARGVVLLFIVVLGWLGWSGITSLWQVLNEGVTGEWLAEGECTLVAWLLWNCVAAAVGLASLPSSRPPARS